MKDYLEKIAAPSMEDGYRLIRQGAALIDGSGFGILKVTGENAAARSERCMSVIWMRISSY